MKEDNEYLVGTEKVSDMDVYKKINSIGNWMQDVASIWYTLGGYNAKDLDLMIHNLGELQKMLIEMRDAK